MGKSNRTLPSLRVAYLKAALPDVERSRIMLLRVREGWAVIVILSLSM